MEVKFPQSTGGSWDMSETDEPSVVEHLKQQLTAAWDLNDRLIRRVKYLKDELAKARSSPDTPRVPTPPKSHRFDREDLYVMNRAMNDSEVERSGRDNELKLQDAGERLYGPHSADTSIVDSERESDQQSLEESQWTRPEPSNIDLDADLEVEPRPAVASTPTRSPARSPTRTPTRSLYFGPTESTPPREITPARESTPPPTQGQVFDRQVVEPVEDFAPVTEPFLPEEFTQPVQRTLPSLEFDFDRRTKFSKARQRQASSRPFSVDSEMRLPQLRKKREREPSDVDESMFSDSIILNPRKKNFQL